MTGLKPAETK